MPADLPAVHDRLREILAPYREDFTVTRDEPAGMTLEVPGLEGKPWGYVAATRVGKRYVSFYLMPHAVRRVLQGRHQAIHVRRVDRERAHGRGADGRVRIGQRGPKTRLRWASPQAGERPQTGDATPRVPLQQVLDGRRGPVDMRMPSEPATVITPAPKRIG